TPRPRRDRGHRVVRGEGPPGHDPGGPGPGGGLPGVSVPGRHPRHHQRLLPALRGERDPQVQGRRGVRARRVHGRARREAPGHRVGRQLPEPARERGLLRGREEAQRDPAARRARPEARHPRRDGLRPRHRRAQDRGAHGGQAAPARQCHGPRDPLLPDPDAHRAGRRPRPLERPDRQVGREGARAGARREGVRLAARSGGGGRTRGGRPRRGTSTASCRGPRAGAGAKVMDRFVRYPEVAKVLSQGETRATVKLRGGLQVDLRAVEPAAYGAALLYFTGSKAHNIELRTIAQEQSYKLNEYGLFKGTRRVAGKTEAEIYAKLGLDLMPPELREARGEIALAREHRL